MNKTLLLILTAALLVVITPFSIAIASDIADAVFFGTIRATNTSAVAPNVSANLSISSGDWIDNGTLNAAANNTAIRNSTGADTEFMPGYDGNPWIVQFDTVPDNGNIDYTLYTGVTGGKIRYFPDTSGMTVSDAAALELGDTSTASISGWVDTDNATRKNLVYKKNSYRTYVSPIVSGNITSSITDNTTETNNYLVPNAPGDLCNIGSETGVACPNHYQNVDDAVGVPNDADYVTSTGGELQVDFYNLASPTFSSGVDINTVSVFMRVKDNATNSFATPYLKLGSANTTGTTRTLPNGVWTNYTEVLARPGGSSWIFSDLENLQVGIGLQYTPAGNSALCSQIYVVVKYYDEVSVSATGITSGEHTIEIKRDNPFWKLGVDATDAEMVLPTTDNLTLNLPLWQTDFNTSGANFTSIDSNAIECDPVGPIWSSEGYIFDKVNDYISIPTSISLGNIFDGGGTIIVWHKADGEGEGTVGMFFSLESAVIQMANIAEAAGKTKAYFVHLRSIANGIWISTDPVFTNSVPSFFAVTYNAGSVANNPIIYVGDNGGALTTLTVGSGLTESTTPIGTRTDGSAKIKYIGGTAGANTVDGIIAETAIYSNITLTASQIADFYNATKAKHTTGDIYNYSATTSVPDNSANPTFAENGSMLYMETANVTIDGVLQGSWEWEYGATFTDDSGNSHDATPSFRTTSSDADVSASLITFKPISEAKVTDSTSITWPVIMADPPDEPSTAYSENITPGIFFAPFVHTIAEFGASNWSGATTNMLEQLFWYTFAFILIMGVSVFVYFFFANNAKEALFIKIFATAAVMIFFALPGINIYGLYVPLYYVLFATGILMLKKDFGW